MAVERMRGVIGPPDARVELIAEEFVFGVLSAKDLGPQDRQSRGPSPGTDCPARGRRTRVARDRIRNVRLTRRVTSRREPFAASRPDRLRASNGVQPAVVAGVSRLRRSTSRLTPTALVLEFLEEHRLAKTAEVRCDERRLGAGLRPVSHPELRSLGEEDRAWNRARLAKPVGASRAARE